MSLYVRFLSTDRSFFSLTKTLVCDRQLFLWQKLLSVTEVFFSVETQKKFVSLMETYFIWQNLLSERNLFLWHKLFFLGRSLLSKIPFFGILYVISRENFLREMGVSVISDNRDNNFVGPRHGLCESFFIGSGTHLDGRALCRQLGVVLHSHQRWCLPHHSSTAPPSPLVNNS